MAHYVTACSSIISWHIILVNLGRSSPFTCTGGGYRMFSVINFIFFKVSFMPVWIKAQCLLLDVLVDEGDQKLRISSMEKKSFQTVIGTGIIGMEYRTPNNIYIYSSWKNSDSYLPPSDLKTINANWRCGFLRCTKMPSFWTAAGFKQTDFSLEKTMWLV